MGCAQRAAPPGRPLLRDRHPPSGPWSRPAPRPRRRQPRRGTPRPALPGQPLRPARRPRPRARPRHQRRPLRPEQGGTASPPPYAPPSHGRTSSHATAGNRKRGSATARLSWSSCASAPKAVGSRIPKEARSGTDGCEAVTVPGWARVYLGLGNRRRRRPLPGRIIRAPLPHLPPSADRLNRSQIQWGVGARNSTARARRQRIRLQPVPNLRRVLRTSERVQQRRLYMQHRMELRKQVGHRGKVWPEYFHGIARGA